MQTVVLSDGAKALVSDEDYELVREDKWYTSTCGYARRNRNQGDEFKQRSMSMQGFIFPVPRGKYRDHINGNRLDNQRENLRICTASENGRNTKVRINSTSGFKGVTFNKRRKTWMAYIGLGTFKTKEEAANEYNRVAKMLFGEFAKLNN